MKTYHTYFGDSQQAESKLKRAESQRVKSDQTSHGIGRHFRRDYEKLSEKVCSFCGLSAVPVVCIILVFVVVVIVVVVIAVVINQSINQSINQLKT